MCGIAGFTHKHCPVEPSYIRNAVRALVHRGPDQQGIYESSQVSLGAARLKIIDLTAGDQPIISEDGDTTGGEGQGDQPQGKKKKKGLLKGLGGPGGAGAPCSRWGRIDS